MNNKLDLEKFLDAYWKYYVMLERRFAKTEEYVAFDEYNNTTYSIEYLSLLQTICSEIDVLAKAIASYHNPTFKGNDAGIKKWGYEVQQHYPDIQNQTVVFRQSRNFIPWGKWYIIDGVNKKGQRYYKYIEGSESPVWWNAYNSVKHARTSIEKEVINFHKANQINVLMSLAALFILNRYMMYELDKDGYSGTEKSNLFAMYGWNDEIEENFFIDEKGHPMVRVTQPW